MTDEEKQEYLDKMYLDYRSTIEKQKRKISAQFLCIVFWYLTAFVLSGVGQNRLTLTTVAIGAVGIVWILRAIFGEGDK